MANIVNGQTYRVNAPKYFTDPPPVIRIEGTDYDVFAKSWMVLDGNPAALQYAARVGLCGLPIEGNVYYGKIDGLGYFVHESELEPVAEAVSHGS